ncbi:serine hydrolase domain-containing protein [Buchananella hordeovulneris]|uniref:serine hydrolase domain-containing protein n=1 Tax=Buchananella hordeovulneris TaxID=52770 RepID=UPI0026DC10D8|nr:serine hydrolase domain-containing protein [Buchananella hordeovulneris]MDO5080435.1 serine hydrolase domain-containing protein [Buchananella hordeovulneris]
MALLDVFPFPAALVLTNAEGEIYREGHLDEQFAWASITKLATALAAHQAVERGLLTLQEPAGPPGASVAHLLAHAAGLDPERDQVVSAPGRRRIYSNFGYEVLGAIIEDAIGLPLDTWIAQEVFGPLGMEHTQYGASAAHGVRGPASDLIRLARELLRPRLLSPATHATMTSPAFAGLPGVLPGYGRQHDNLWALGPELKGDKSPHWLSAAHSPASFGHFGQAGGFLWVEPRRGVAAVFLGAQPFGTTHVRHWPDLNVELLARA